VSAGRPRPGDRDLLVVDEAAADEAVETFSRSAARAIVDLVVIGGHRPHRRPDSPAGERIVEPDVMPRRSE
jgi:hypothetical protein